MPKFYRQNKKRIDPRYFLNETTNRDADGDGTSNSDELRAIANTLDGDQPGEDLLSNLDNMDTSELENLRDDIESDRYGRKWFPEDYSGKKRQGALDQIWDVLRARGVSHPYDSQSGDMEDSWMGARKL